MSTTQTRLNAYLASEAAILRAQEVRGGDRSYRAADLAEVRKGIKDLQAQLAREQESAATGRRVSFALADLSGQ